MSSENLKPGEVFEQDVQHCLTESGLSYEKRRVMVGDESDPVARHRLNLVFDMWSAHIEAHREEFPIPSKKNNYQSNPAYDWFYKHEQPDVEGTMEEWLTLVPSARALYAMQVIDDMERVFPSGQVTERARDILTHSLDAVAIRARAAIMKSIVLKYAAQSTENDFNLVSLGAGAAVPAINAVVDIEQQFGKKTFMNLYDQDPDILGFAKESTARAGILGYQVATHVGDYYDAFKLPPESVNVLEALGLFEYLHDSRCQRLIKEAYQLLKPGGVLVFSNMLDSRPQRAFHESGVAWPGVKMRSEEGLIQLVADAEIDTSLVTYTVSEDGVYAVVEIHKP